MLTILERAWKGVSMNQTAFCLPSHINISESYLMGRGDSSHGTDASIFHDTSALEPQKLT